MGTYKNAMELLVEEEVKQQLKALPTRTVSYVNQVELVAYALNQLPALYATSEKGLDHQLQKARIKYGAQITQAVHRALAAVRRDPIRTAAPLKVQQPPTIHAEVLQQLKRLLRNDRIDWETLPIAVEQALLKADLANYPVQKPPQRFQYRSYVPNPDLPLRGGSPPPPPPPPQIGKTTLPKETLPPPLRPSPPGATVQGIGRPPLKNAAPPNSPPNLPQGVKAEGSDEPTFDEWGWNTSFYRI